MSDQFSLFLDTKTHDGKMDAAKSIATKLVAAAKSEAGTLSYRCLVDPATNRLCFLDNYASSEAFVEHMQRAEVSKYIDQLMAVADIQSVNVLGTVTPAARKILTGMGATFTHEHAGFARSPVVTH